MALVIVATLVALPLVLLVVDLLRPRRTGTDRFAGAPLQAAADTPAGAATADPVAAAASPVRAPIAAAQRPSTTVARTEPQVVLPAAHADARPAVPAALLGALPATAGAAPAQLEGQRERRRGRTATRRDYFGDGLLASTVAQRSDAA
ncbi:hypothetical protein [Paraconexibacter algicola]|uniref:hypothetical protein n=1 Tax=Paraconexibacter algicola TaxID=2133960 RepID=UPI0011B20A17|nr:hypothetical protein [Paraconexibacter algicola]